MHCEWAMHALRQRKWDCLSHFCSFSWNQCRDSVILHMEALYPCGAFLLHCPFSLCDFIRAFLYLACSVVMQWFSCWDLPDSHILWAYCSVWIVCGSTVWACKTAADITQDSLWECSSFTCFGLFAISTYKFILFLTNQVDLISMILFGWNTKEAVSLRFPNIKVMSSLL